ncbi:hypothetical protein BDD12DRAFT_807449 [Trichophaea hybrida]|nr:hypothetical protein BDD12DRAFT_807449 [Trichophaea hybrida]
MQYSNNLRFSVLSAICYFLSLEIDQTLRIPHLFKSPFFVIENGSEKYTHFAHYYRLLRSKNYTYPEVCNEYFRDFTYGEYNNCEHQLYHDCRYESLLLASQGTLYEAYHTITTIVQYYNGINGEFAYGLIKDLASTINKFLHRKPRQCPNNIQGQALQRRNAAKLRYRKTLILSWFQKFWDRMDESVKTQCIESPDACDFCKVEYDMHSLSDAYRIVYRERREREERLRTHEDCVDWITAAHS